MKRYKNIYLRLDENIAKDFKKICALKEIYLNMVMNELIRKFVEENRKLLGKKHD